MQALRRYRGELRDSEQREVGDPRRGPDAARASPRRPSSAAQRSCAELQQRLNAAVAGECQFVVIAGDAGVGKTRLLDELEKLAQRAADPRPARPVRRAGRSPSRTTASARRSRSIFRQREGGSSAAARRTSPISRPTWWRCSRCSARSRPSAPSRQRGARGADAESRQPEDRTQIFELLARTLIRLAGGEAARPPVRGPARGRRLDRGAALHRPPARADADLDRRHLPLGGGRQRHPLTAMLDGFQGDRRFAAMHLEPLNPSRASRAADDPRRRRPRSRTASPSGCTRAPRATRSSPRSWCAR